MLTNQIKEEILHGQTVLGIELGSTRIKAVLINSENQPIAQGGHDWENTLLDGVWTYSLDDVWKGIQSCFASLQANIQKDYAVKLTRTKAMGISAMMHGYLPFDAKGNQLTAFRTWRNTMTSQAAELLSTLFDYRFLSVVHITSLSVCPEQGRACKGPGFPDYIGGYVHWKLTGRKVLGVGDASGMFPIDTKTGNYDQRMVEAFDDLTKAHHFPWRLETILPSILSAGEDAGKLTDTGALLLAPSGTFEAGIPLCPPEGDAGTGMVATNSIAKRTGNVSAGTSVFAMIVLEKELSKSYNKFIDLVTTPDGSLVAMSHGNNCTGEYDNWMRLFSEVLTTAGFSLSKGELYDRLLFKALEGDKECGGLLPYNYLSGETMTDLNEGRPLFVRETKHTFNLANFMRSQLFTALGVLRIGMDILFEQEKVAIDSITGHGGFFKTAEVGQKMMASALHTPISVLKTAGEGGAWGIALLASFMVGKQNRSLADFLASEAFATAEKSTVEASEEDIEGFNVFLERYKHGLAVEKAAVQHLK
jgi:sugar (pentulose or hexulose) kinase